MAHAQVPAQADEVLLHHNPSERDKRYLNNLVFLAHFSTK